MRRRGRRSQLTSADVRSSRSLPIGQLDCNTPGSDVGPGTPTGGTFRRIFEENRINCETMSVKASRGLQGPHNSDLCLATTGRGLLTKTLRVSPASLSYGAAAGGDLHN